LGRSPQSPFRPARSRCRAKEVLADNPRRTIHTSSLGLRFIEDGPAARRDWDAAQPRALGVIGTPEHLTRAPPETETSIGEEKEKIYGPRNLASGPTSNILHPTWQEQQGECSMAAAQEKTTKNIAGDATATTESDVVIDRTAPAGSKNSLGAQSVRDGRPATDDSTVEAMDEESPDITAR
jgi:hypothetical protein